MTFGDDDLQQLKEQFSLITQAIRNKMQELRFPNTNAILSVSPLMYQKNTGEY